jgi:hypothetical protein
MSSIRRILSSRANGARSHLDRLQPTDEFEFGSVEQMVAAYRRLRRNWAVEARMVEKQTDAGAYEDLSKTPAMSLIHRYETRFHMIWNRALQNLMMLRLLDLPNEPSPDSGHPDPIPALPAPGEDTQ